MRTQLRTQITKCKTLFNRDNGFINDMSENQYKEKNMNVRREDREFNIPILI